MDGEQRLQIPVSLDEMEARIADQEGTIANQANTIHSFQQRVFRLEMEIIELMTLIESGDAG